jgi:oxygen-independent coproporphyrinogen-3 oxidase
MEEFMFLGLRMTAGVSCGTFLQRFGTPIGSVYREILRRQTGAGLLIEEDGRFRLTERGLDLANTVMAEYLF